MENGDFYVQETVVASPAEEKRGHESKHVVLHAHLLLGLQQVSENSSNSMSFKAINLYRTFGRHGSFGGGISLLLNF